MRTIKMSVLGMLLLIGVDPAAATDEHVTVYTAPFADAYAGCAPVDIQSSICSGRADRTTGRFSGFVEAVASGTPELFGAVVPRIEIPGPAKRVELVYRVRTVAARASAKALRGHAAAVVPIRAFGTGTHLIMASDGQETVSDEVVEVTSVFPPTSIDMTIPAGTYDFDLSFSAGVYAYDGPTRVQACSGDAGACVRADDALVESGSVSFDATLESVTVTVTPAA